MADSPTARVMAAFLLDYDEYLRIRLVTFGKGPMGYRSINGLPIYHRM